MRTEQTPKYETNVSDERLDVILINECGAPPGLATSRFRRLANEIADRDERIARLEGALNAAPTEAPVPLAAQIEKVRREVRYAQEDRAERAERLWSAVLASLQQHERAMAVVEAARSCAGIWPLPKPINDALAALDDAASAAGDEP